MKTISTFMIAFLLIGMNAISAQNFSAQTVALKEKAPISWDKMQADLCNVQQNIPVTAEFTITNESDEPILITQVKATCGCTVPKYNEDPILPGESTSIFATYNAKKEGKFNKTIKVSTSATAKPIPLKLTGTVVKADAISISGKL